MYWYISIMRLKVGDVQVFPTLQSTISCECIGNLRWLWILKLMNTAGTKSEWLIFGKVTFNFTIIVTYWRVICLCILSRPLVLSRNISFSLLNWFKTFRNMFRVVHNNTPISIGFNREIAYVGTVDFASTVEAFQMTGLYILHIMSTSYTF